MAVIDAECVYKGNDLHDPSKIEENARGVLINNDLAFSMTRVYIIGSRIPVVGQLLDTLP